MVSYDEAAVKITPNTNNKTRNISTITPIKEIAARLGYCDVFHFSKNFTKQIGTPPAEYKKSFHTKE